MSVDIHPGSVIHSMDHFVLDLAAEDGSSSYFTVYSLGMMQDVGTGLVALLHLSTPDGVHDYCFGETIGLAARMQARLRAMRPDGAPLAGTTGPPRRAAIRRDPISDLGVSWRVETDEHSIAGTWGSPEPPLWLRARAPAFHPTRDYTTVMVSYRQAELTIDGERAGGTPFEHPEWTQRLGRPFSSCHAALSETAGESK